MLKTPTLQPRDERHKPCGRHVGNRKPITVSRGPHTEQPPKLATPGRYRGSLDAWAVGCTRRAPPQRGAGGQRADEEPNQPLDIARCFVHKKRCPDPVAYRYTRRGHGPDTAASHWNGGATALLSDVQCACRLRCALSEVSCGPGEAARMGLEGLL